MSAQNNQNRKMQNLINGVKIADDAVGNDELGAYQTKTMVYSFGSDISQRDVGAHVLSPLAGTTLPDNAIVTGYHVDVTTPLASSGSATIALGFATDGAGIVKAATAFDDASFVAATQKGGVPVASKKLTAARPLLATVGTAALTAGVMLIYIQYIEGSA
mgnify:CR=1 FL=1